MTARRIAVYGDVDLNYIDGSSIWLVSLCSVLSRLPEVEVDLLLKAPLRRDVLSRELPASVRLHEPPSRRTPQAVAAALRELDEVEPFDVFIVRGRQIASFLVDQDDIRHRLWAYLTDVPQNPDQLGHENERELRKILSGASRVLCQTEDMRAWFAWLVPECDRKLLLLPPMVPDDAFRPHSRPWLQNGLRLLYAGKFAPDWGFVEVVDRVKALREAGMQVTLVVAGDKIHDPPDNPDFASSVRRALADPVVDWRGGLSRSAVFDLLDEADLAVSVRTSALDDSRELSTKLLEYAAAGVPVVANRTRAHIELFGADYPFLVGGFEELPSVLRAAGESPDLLGWASKTVREVAADYSYAAAARALERALREAPPAHHRGATVPRLLVAGHDLKFIQPLVEGWVAEGYDVSIDKWAGHNCHDRRGSIRLLEESDLVVCEWLLGNAEFYANHAHRAPVVVRLHRMEIDTEWPRRLPIDKVEKVVVVAPHVRCRLLEDLGYPEEKVVVIPNGVDVCTYARPKLPGAEFTLGMLGYLPRLKRLDRAIRLLRMLREHDPRYHLVVKGRAPEELDWVWNNPDERSYYQALRREIAEDPELAMAVTFEASGSDVPSWFRKVGYVLSPSDVESFHLAMVEGMASGAVPIVWHREGADELVDERWIHATTEAAADWILDHAAERETEARLAADFVSDRYSLSIVRDAWSEVISSALRAQKSGEATMASPASPPFDRLTASDILPRLKSLVPDLSGRRLNEPFRYRDGSPSEADREATRALAGGRFQPTPLLPPVEMAPPPAWEQNPFDNRTWDFSRHSLEWLEPVVRAAVVDKFARDLAVSIVTDWIEANSRPPGVTPYVWNDHTAAIRARVILFMLHVFDRHELWKDSERDLIVASLVQHGAFLADPNHYRPRSNHGLEMDASLLALALAMPGIRYSGQWQKVAEERIDEYLRANYSRRFVHLEQSPAYHLFVTIRLASVLRFLEANEFPVPARLARVVAGAVAVWPYIRRPDGSAPMIGDTSAFPKPKDFEETHHRLLGRRPSSIAPEDRLNPRSDGSTAFVDVESGYALYSDHSPSPERKADRRTFHVAVKCNTFESPHYHHDAGSFVVWWEGLEWIIDPGYYSMEEHTVERQFMRSARAHNVVIVDGADFGFRPFRVVDVFRRPSGDGLEMEHDLGSVVHRRRVVVNPVARRIEIRDRLESVDGRSHQVTQLLHLHPKLEVVARDGRIEARAGERTLSVIRAGDRRPEILRGDDRDGQPAAWYSPDYLVREPSWLLRWTETVEHRLDMTLLLAFDRESG